MSLKLDKRCETCGAQVIIDDGGLKAVCGYCGNRYSFVRPLTPKYAADVMRAENYRLRNLFDNAIVEYKTLLSQPEYAETAELYWGLFLSEYGIEYVHDKLDDVYVPTCHRTVKTPVFANENYLNAVKYATPEMSGIYAERGREIADIQEGIWQQAALTDDYDVFICFKSTDKKAATEDRYIARKIFDELTKRGFRTFFSEVTLKNKLGADYEPIIYKALSTARVMLLVCTNEEYLDAPFVRNEWARFKDRMSGDRKLSLIPVFKNMHHSALPTKEQGVDLDKYPAGGYEIDIADNLESMLGKRTVPKVDKEILEEYAQYNEINKYKFEKSYQVALREVDLSYKRTKNAGLEYAAKAAEMHDLGDYRNAQVLAAEYGKKAENYIVQERKLKDIKVRRSYLKFGLAVIMSIIISICMTTAAYYNNNQWAWQPNAYSTQDFILMTTFAIIAISITFVTAFAYLIVRKVTFGESYNKTARFFLNLFEFIPYVISEIILISYVIFTFTAQASLVFFLIAVGLNSVIIYISFKQAKAKRLKIIE